MLYVLFYEFLVLQTITVVPSTKLTICADMCEEHTKCRVGPLGYN